MLFYIEPENTNLSTYELLLLPKLLRRFLQEVRRRR
jgi:hypothetical protein